MNRWNWNTHGRPLDGSSTRLRLLTRFPALSSLFPLLSVRLPFLTPFLPLLCTFLLVMKSIQSDHPTVPTGRNVRAWEFPSRPPEKTRATPPRDVDALPRRAYRAEPRRVRAVSAVPIWEGTVQYEGDEAMVQSVRYSMLPASQAGRQARTRTD